MLPRTRRRNRRGSRSRANAARAVVSRASTTCIGRRMRDMRLRYANGIFVNAIRSENNSLASRGLRFTYLRLQSVQFISALSDSSGKYLFIL